MEVSIEYRNYGILEEVDGNLDILVLLPNQPTGSDVIMLKQCICFIEVKKGATFAHHYRESILKLVALSV